MPPPWTWPASAAVDAATASAGREIVMRQAFVPSLMVVLALAFGACTREPSERVAAGAIRASYTLDVTDGGARATAYLKAAEGGLAGAYLDLSEGDRLTVVSGGEEYALARFQDAFGAVGYSAHLPVAGTTRFVFRRTGAEAPYEAEVALPARFRIIAPVAGVPAPAWSDELVILWTPPEPGALIDLTLAAHCRDAGAHERDVSSTFSVGDSGQARIPFKTILEGSGLVAEARCERLRVSLTRSVDGRPPAGLHPDSRITASRTRRVEYAD